MNNQEAFDKVARHLLTQNERAVEGVSFCKLLTSDGKKCAIGCLIPEGEYFPAMEGMNFAAFPFLQGVSSKLLEHLQWIHDKQRPSSWKKRLAAAAEAFGLDDKVLNDF